MDVLQGQLIDIGLNVVGFVAGGGLLMILSSTLKSRKERPAATMAVTPQPEVVAEEKPSAPPVRKQESNVEFISLTAEEPKRPTQAGPKTAIPTGSIRRNRAEVIKMAREMLAAKKTEEEIVSSLPVTEAELAMLNPHHTAEHGVENV